MLKQKNALPGAKLHFPINNRHHLARSRQDHANVRRHVIAAFRTVSEVISLFWHQSIEKFFHVMSRARIVSIVAWMSAVISYIPLPVVGTSSRLWWTRIRRTVIQRCDESNVGGILESLECRAINPLTSTLSP